MTDSLQVGGNAAAMAFFNQHGWTSGDLPLKYNSRAAQMYRERLHSLALKALKANGQRLHMDSIHATEGHSPKDKDEEFFNEDNFSRGGLTEVKSDPVLIRNVSAAKLSGHVDDGVGPSVDEAVSTSPKTDGYKPTLLAGRKPGAAAKKGGGLGVRKGGLGAQKVATNFDAIELAALEKEKEAAAARSVTSQAKVAPTSPVAQMASLNLAYKELSLDEKQRDEKLKNLDPKKKEQVSS